MSYCTTAPDQPAIIICICISPEAGSQENKQTRKQQAKNKYYHLESLNIKTAQY